MAQSSTAFPGTNWTPALPSERYAALDLLRGFSLLGVLLINLLYFFRVHLFDHILHFHSHPGWLNHAIDLLAAEFIEFKAFDLFTLTFGIGVALQAERANRRGVTAELFLLRRFLILLVFGVCHMVFVSNVDILVLYAVCAVLMTAFLRLPTPVLALLGVAGIYLPSIFSGWSALPPEATWPTHVENATRIYSTGSFGTILEFRWHETGEMIFPLLAAAAQKTVGLMLLGVALWRTGIVAEPRRYRAALWAVCLIAGGIGLVNTTADVLAESGKRTVHIFAALKSLGSHVPLAFAYAAALMNWRRSARVEALIAPVAAAGRMSLTNYLMQSIAFAVLFYGYGFRLFGRLDPQTATLIGLAFYAAQLWFSAWWLKRYRFGPFEWLWRSLTYGRRQPMRNPS